MARHSRLCGSPPQLLNPTPGESWCFSSLIMIGVVSRCCIRYYRFAWYDTVGPVRSRYTRSLFFLCNAAFFALMLHTTAHLTLFHLSFLLYVVCMHQHL